MEPYKIKVDVPENPKIKSETPGEQKLREDFFVQNHEENSSSADSFSPVFKMTKQETSFTKGDQKVQKVFIKQDVADGSSRYLIEIPLNPNIQSSTIEKPHLIRFQDPNNQNYEDSKDEKENKVTLPPPKSKIPRLGDKLKHIVDQMKFDGIATEKKNVDKSSARPSGIPQPQPRAPPRFKRIQRKKTAENLDKSYDNHTKNNDEFNKSNGDQGKNNDKNNKIYETKTTPEVEFDKLFEEIVDKEPNPILVAKVLNVRPDSITDVKFEQIIHDYDTNKLKPIFIDEQSFLNKSKIPLLRRKSEDNSKVSGYLKLFQNKSQNMSDIKPVEKPEINDMITKRSNVVNETLIQNNEEVILRRKKIEACDDDTNKVECKKYIKESRIPLLKQISNESIKYPGTHRRASLKKSISHIENNISDVKENEISNGIVQTHEDGKVEKDNKNINDDSEISVTIARKEKVMEVSTDIERKIKEGEKRVSGKVEVIESNRHINNISEKENEKDKGEAKFFIHALRMKYEKLSRENSQEHLFDEKIKPSHEIEDVNHIQKKKEVTIYDNSEILKEKIVSSDDVLKSETTIQVPYENKPSKRDTKAITESAKNDGRKTPILELRKKFEYLSRENSQESIKISGNALKPFEIELTDEKIEGAKNDDAQISTQSHEKLEPVKRNVIHQYAAKNANFKDTKPKHSAIEKRVPITSLLRKFESLSRENSFIDSHEEKREKENSIVTNGEEEEVETIEEIDVLELHDAVEIDIETLDADLEEEVDDFGQIKLKSHDIDVAKDKVAPKKSVLSKVELFERQKSRDSPPISPSHHHEKPKIVEEVLKTPTMKRKEKKLDENVIKPQFNRITEIPIHNTATTFKIEENSIEKVQITNDNKERDHNDKLIINISYTIQDSKTVKTNESENFTENQKKYEKNQEIKPSKDNFTAHNLVHDRKSRFENTNIEVTGKETHTNKISKEKVNNMVNKIGSIENLLVDGKNLLVGDKSMILPKERPRRNSVSEKIALFERKLTVFNMEDPVKKNITTDGRATSTEKLAQISRPHPNEKQNGGTANNIDPVNEKLQEFKNARQKYGSYDQMAYFKLNSGDKIPAITLGTALLDPTLLRPVIETAIDLGYRAFDCALIYGNDKEVGQAIRNKIQDGTVKREDLFISSKLWSTFHRPDLVSQACQTTLDNLGLEYLDLFMIHNPMSLKEGTDLIPMIANVLQYSEYDYMDAWYAMERLLDTGKVKNIGVSNFNSEQIRKILDKGKVRPVVNQVESHPYLSQERLQAFCDPYNIQLQCYGVLGSFGTPKEYKGPDSKVALEDPLVKVMAAGLNVTPAQLLISYQLHSGRAVVVKASSADRLWSNLQALELQLTEDQIKALNALNTNTRNFTLTGMGGTHKNYPFNIPF